MQHLMDNHLRIAAIGDLHSHNGSLRAGAPALFLDSRADVLVITGDITNGGRIQEVEIACDLLKRVRIPMLTVLGNHDRRTTRRGHFIRFWKATGYACSIQGPIRSVASASPE